MICPKCGNGIPEESNGVCYTCVRIEGEQKRYGNRQQRRGYGGNDGSSRSNHLPGWKFWRKPHRRSGKWEPWKLGGQRSSPATRPAKRLSREQQRLKPRKKPQEKPRKKQRKETKKSTSSRKPAPKPVEAPTGPMDYREVRKGINRFLEQLYARQIYLSTLLERQGLTGTRVKRLRSREHFQDFLQLLMDRWRWWLKECLSPAEVETLRRYYGFDGKGMRSFREIADEDGIADRQVRERWQGAIEALSTHARREELERRTVDVAREMRAEE